MVLDTQTNLLGLQINLIRSRWKNLAGTRFLPVHNGVLQPLITM